MTWRKGDRAAFAEIPDVLGRLWALGGTLGAAGLQLSLTSPGVHSHGQDYGSRWALRERLGSRWKQKAGHGPREGQSSGPSAFPMGSLGQPQAAFPESLAP